MKLSVIIVSYNVRHYLAQCIDSVLRATRQMEAEVWVVDNCSTDGTVAFLRDLFPSVHYIENGENVGFARANNQAIRQSTGEYVLLLNPDTFVGEDVLRSCTDFLDQHPEAGATGTMMLNRDGTFARESRRGVPTPATAFYKVTGLCSLFPRSPRFGRYYMGHLDPEKTAEIEIISGAFFMLRRTALQQVGLLSEDYFMYGEDIDLSYSLLLAGWKNFYQPLPILHYKGESTVKTSFRYVHSFGRRPPPHAPPPPLLAPLPPALAPGAPGRGGERGLGHDHAAGGTTFPHRAQGEACSTDPALRGHGRGVADARGDLPTGRNRSPESRLCRRSGPNPTRAYLFIYMFPDGRPGLSLRRHPRPTPQPRRRRTKPATRNLLPHHTHPPDSR